MKKLFSIICAICCAMIISAADAQVGGIYYNFNSDGTAEVTYRGVSYSSYNGEYSGSVTIPSSVSYNGRQYRVTSIARGAFSDCTGLTSITIPNSVTSIGERAFSGCSGLTSIVVDSENSFYDSRLGCNAIIETNTNTLVAGCVNTVIPNSVTSIGDDAFWGCSGLTSITIPNSVTSIGEGAFWDCSGLTSITISNSVTSIGVGAFWGCTGLTSITIPNSVTSIDESAFSGCSGLTSIVVDSENSFYDSRLGCNAIIETNTNTLVAGCVNTVIPNSVTSIGGYAFYRCSGLTSITIPNSVTSIGEGAFWGCSGLTSITIPNSVTGIGRFAFDECSRLTSVTIPNSVTSIAWGAFSGCSGLTSVTIPNSVTSIGGEAFYDCTGLNSITIPNSVTSIGNKAFYNVFNVLYTGNATGAPWGALHLNKISEGVFIYSDSLMTVLKGCKRTVKDSVVIPSSVVTIGDFAFAECSGLTSVTIPNSVTSIGHDAFRGCSGLTSITIPNSVTSIGSNAFYGCSRLTSVTWNATQCSILDYIPVSGGYAGGEYPFYNIRNQITSFVFGNSVVSIPGHVCSGMSALTSITIPNSVTSIGGYAFSGCSGLTSVTIPNSVTSIGGEAFYDCTGLNSITIPNSVTSIGNKAFQGCSSLTSVTIPNSVTSIGDKAFNSCSGLTSITIGNGVTDIGWNTFQGCSGLTSITIPNSVTSIGGYAFSGCSGLKSVTIGNGVTDIGWYTFQGCSRLTSITIPNSVTSIGGYAFSGCSGLTSITIGNGVTDIGWNTFQGCTSLTSVTLSSQLTQLEKNTFEGCTDIREIYSYATVPPTCDDKMFENLGQFTTNVYVPAGSVEMYKVALGWRYFFNILPIGTTSADATNGSVTILPGDNDATFTWPTENSADTYTLQITKDGEVFCTLTFNSNGQLLSIAFAPARNGEHAQAPAAEMSVNGMSFRVTGLDFATHYGYGLQVKDNASNVLQSYSGYFHTNGTTGWEEISTSKTQKIFRDGHFYILRDGQLYDFSGRRVE